MPNDSSPLFVEVLLDQQIGKGLDYSVPPELHGQIQIGQRVEVPFRTGVKQGTISEIKKQSKVPSIKPIGRLISERAALAPPLWALASWMAEYYCTPLQKVLRCFIPPNMRRPVKAQATTLDRFWADQEFFPTQPKTLTSQQKECLDKIDQSLASNKYAAHLIHGITGSGKTEIYLQAIARAMEQGKSALLLVPEIALTTQTIERFRSRFPQRIAVLHHRLGLGERTAAWNALDSGEVTLAIGARSAIFCPAKKLGLIIIDEEHDSSYKQSGEAPAYHGRDVAVMRAYLEKATILLGSATPSLESYLNAEKGKYILSTLTSRATAASLPSVTIVDMQRARERSGGFTHFAPELLQAIKQRTAAGEQTLLFLNKRGYHRMQTCSSCRAIIKCPHCDLSLTYHRSQSKLACHLCDYQIDPPRECPQCKSTDSIQFKGFGTEHVERSLKAIFPEIRTLRMDRDTTRTKDSHETLFQQFRAHKADVLIGTQMIAKGFHFPSVTLVGILNSDASLQIPDFRSQETIFQLLTQVAGRAGRASLPGEVILQTYFPDHPIFRLAASQDYLAFYKAEIEERRLFSYPPFSHLIRLLFSGPDPATVEAEAERCRQLLLQSGTPSQILPVAPCGHPKIKDQHRFQFLIKTPSIKSWTAKIAALRSSEKLLIDVDPISTFF